MVDPGKRPAQYLVRVWNERVGNIEFRPWAYSAEDAKFQIRENILSRTSIIQDIMYVGPINPDCKCFNQCQCGAMAQ